MNSGCSWLILNSLRSMSLLFQMLDRQATFVFSYFSNFFVFITVFFLKVFYDSTWLCLVNIILHSPFLPFLNQVPWLLLLLLDW